jgi:hypothetical protein
VASRGPAGQRALTTQTSSSEPRHPGQDPLQRPKPNNAAPILNLGKVAKQRPLEPEAALELAHGRS